MKRVVAVFALLTVASAGAWSQHLMIESSMHRTGASVGGAILQAPSLAGDQTFWFPTVGGTLVTDASFSGWLTTGNTLPGPGSGLIGSTNAYDVDLIAGGASNVRMTLLNGTAAVLLPAQTELRLGDAAGGEYSALKSPATLPSSITYILPNVLPDSARQRLQVESVSGSVVTLGYTTVEKSTDVSFDTKTTFTETTSTTPIDVADMSIAVLPYKTYAFEAMVSVQHDAGNANAEISFGLPTDADLHYFAVELTLNNPQATGNLTEAAETYTAPASPNEKHYLLRGFVRTEANGGTVQMKLASTSGNLIRLTKNSYLQITTN